FPHGNNPFPHGFEFFRCRLEPETIHFRPSTVGLLFGTYRFRAFRYCFVPDRCVLATDPTFFAPYRYTPAQRHNRRRGVEDPQIFGWRHELPGGASGRVFWHEARLKVAISPRSPILRATGLVRPELRSTVLYNSGRVH